MANYMPKTQDKRFNQVKLKVAAEKRQRKSKLSAFDIENAIC